MKTEVKEELLKLFDGDEEAVEEFELKLDSTNRLIEEEGLITRRKPAKRKVARKPGKTRIRIKSNGSPRNLARIAQRSLATLEAKERKRVKVSHQRTRPRNVSASQRVTSQSIAQIKKIQAETTARLTGKSKSVDLPDSRHLTIEEIEQTNLSHLRKRQLRAAAISRLTHDGKSMSEAATESVAGLTRKYVDD